MAEEPLIRRQSLRDVCAKFEAHLAAYSPSSESLRDLTIELRDDDDSAGWPILKRFAPQLRRLEVHMLDRMWLEAHAYDDRYHNANPSSAPVKRKSANTSDVWYRVLDYNTIVFNQLVSLNLAATSRVLDHLAALSRSVPNLLDLTLSSHCYEEIASFNYRSSGINPDSDNDGAFAKLRMLSVTGNSSLLHAVEQILTSALSLAQLFIHQSGRPVRDSPDLLPSLIGMFGLHSGDASSPTSFAMIGTRTTAFLHELQQHLNLDGTFDYFSNLRDLYLGQEIINGLGYETWSYPLLQGVSFTFSFEIVPNFIRFTEADIVLGMADTTQD